MGDAPLAEMGGGFLNFWRLFLRMGKRTAVSLIKAYIWTMAVVRTPFFIVFRWRNVPKNNFVYLCWHWSFGHTITGLDYASRLYYPRRISVIYIPHSGSNPLLPHCFAHNMDVFTYEQGPRCRSWERFDMPITYNVVRFYLLLWTAVSGRFHFLQKENVYQTISLAQDRLLQGNNVEGRIEKFTDYTGYLRMLHDGIGEKPHLPLELDVKCREAIRTAFPSFFEKPFVTLLLRQKGKGGVFDSSYRCAGPSENYLPAVRYLVEQGFHLVGTGETEHRPFDHIPGYFNLDRVGIPPQLLNLFVLMNCCFFIGQQSGPLNLINSCGIPSLVADAVPYRVGSLTRSDLVLFKHFKDQNNGHVLNLTEVFRNHLDLAYGYNFAQKNIEVEPNSPDEILAAVEESLSRIRGDLRISEEDLLLCQKFKELIPPEMSLFYHGNRPPLAILRKEKDALLRREQEISCSGKVV